MDYGIKHGMKRFLYVSSGEIYGEGDGRVLQEEYSGYVDCMKPRSCYPSSKRTAETLCVSYAYEYGADVVIARPCHVYGPHFTESDNRVYAQFIRNILRGEDIVMKSTGEQFRSWCYSVDCVTALLYVLLKGTSGEAYNIADPTSVLTIRQLAEMVAGIGNRQVVMEIPTETEKASYNPVTKSVFSVNKLNGLGWEVSGSMEEKMRKTINRLNSR
jgi:nucleoside-diphosphate-sugar epimerase